MEEEQRLQGKREKTKTQKELIEQGKGTSLKGNKTGESDSRDID